MRRHEYAADAEQLLQQQPQGHALDDCHHSQVTRREDVHRSFPENLSGKRLQDVRRLVTSPGRLREQLVEALPVDHVYQGGPSAARLTPRCCRQRACRDQQPGRRTSGHDPPDVMHYSDSRTVTILDEPEEHQRRPLRSFGMDSEPVDHALDGN